MQKYLLEPQESGVEAVNEDWERAQDNTSKRIKFLDALNSDDKKRWTFWGNSEEIVKPSYRNYWNYLARHLEGFEDFRFEDLGYILGSDTNDGETAEERNDPDLKNAHEADECCDPDSINGYEAESFLMVTQQNWEENVIWDASEQHAQLEYKDPEYWAACYITNTKPKFNLSNQTFAYHRRKDCKSSGDQLSTDFCYIQNPLLLDYEWEKDVIWDAENINKGANAKPDIIEYCEEISEAELAEKDLDRRRIKSSESKPHSRSRGHLKGSREILKRIGFVDSVQSADYDGDGDEDTEHSIAKKDPFNISNDEFYQPKKIPSNASETPLQHSIPTRKLEAPFIPTHHDSNNLKFFHRPRVQLIFERTPVDSLVQFMIEKDQERGFDSLRDETWDVFYMKIATDLSAKDGNLLLFEYSEEYPPLLSEIGMCSKIVKYQQKAKGEKSTCTTTKSSTNVSNRSFGITKFISSKEESPFHYGRLRPGQCVTALENNMYRAPVFDHTIHNLTDFILLISADKLYIREMDGVYTVGQEFPLIEVPAPGTAILTDFRKRRLNVFIHREFEKSESKSLDLCFFQHAFPDVSAKILRSILKKVAKFSHSNRVWVLHSTTFIPCEDELQSRVTPEECCAYLSYLAAKQRLECGGYDETALHNIMDSQWTADEEMVAPWNTTRFFLEAKKGKCRLDLLGPADPTGCGRGFSFLRVGKKASEWKIDIKKDKLPDTKKKIDYRGLTVDQAKTMLKKIGIPHTEFEKLNRWQMVGLLQYTATEKEKSLQYGTEESATNLANLHFLSRAKPNSNSEQEERYQKTFQRIFDQQILELSSGYKEDKLEPSRSANKDGGNQSFENEEKERLELIKWAKEADSNKKISDSSVTEKKPDRSRVLKIVRTYRADDGSGKDSTEVIRNNDVIDLYVKLKKKYSDEELRKLIYNLD